MKASNSAMYLLPLIAGCLWGSVGPFVRILDEAGFNNQTILFVRVSIASVLLFAFLLVYNRSLLRIKLKDLWIFAVCGILGTTFLNIFYNIAITKLTLALSACLLECAPLIVVFLAALLFREKITVQKIVCILIAMFGIVLLSGLLESAQTLSFIGLAAGAMSAFCWAIYTIGSRVGMEHGYAGITITFYSMLMATIVLTPFASMETAVNYVLANPLPDMGFLVLHSLCTSVLPYVLFTVSLQHIDTGKAAILSASFEPIAALLFGIVLYAENPSILNLAGLVLVIFALSVLTLPNLLKGRKKEEDEAQTP